MRFLSLLSVLLVSLLAFAFFLLLPPPALATCGPCQTDYGGFEYRCWQDYCRDCVARDWYICGSYWTTCRYKEEDEDGNWHWYTEPCEKDRWCQGGCTQWEYNPCEKCEWQWVENCQGSCATPTPAPTATPTSQCDPRKTGQPCYDVKNPPPPSQKVYCCPSCDSNPRNCYNGSETAIECNTASDCPNKSVKEQCGDKACSVGKQCTSEKKCQYYCEGTPPCGGAGPTPTPGPGPTPPPTCSVDLQPKNSSLAMTATLGFVANVTPSNGTVERVDFSSSNTSVATLSPASDATDPYNTTVTGVSPGTTTISTSVVMNGASTCSDTANLTITSPGAWWQVKDGDVITNGNLQSSIPSSCTSPCDPNFGLQGIALQRDLESIVHNANRQPSPLLRTS